MNYWLTTHWPPLIDEEATQVGKRAGVVWLKEGHEAAGQDLRSGDLVAIYEFKGGPPEKKRTASGLDDTRHRQQGREAVVAVARVVSELLADPDRPPEEYQGRKPIRWLWCAEAVIL